MPLIVITAWEGLIDRANIRSGHTLLIQGGGGGVGHVAIQIALARGATVFATGSTKDLARISLLGATAIDRERVTVEEYVAIYSQGRGFDVVYDTVGGAILDASFNAVAQFGHVVSTLGWGSHSLAPLSFRAATYSGGFTLLPLLTGVGRSNHGHILHRAAELAEQHQLKPLLAEEQFGPNDIARAYDAVAKGSKGKVVLEL